MAKTRAVNMEVIKSSGGYTGVAWTEKGLVVLTLPFETESAAREELEREYQALPRVREKNGGAGQSQAPDMSQGGQPMGGALTRERVVAALAAELGSYFSGQCTSFSPPVDWDYYTPFQVRVLSLVVGIPWGRVMSYGQVAMEAGVPRGARAVGGALGSNRVLLIIPCHRVIRGDGSLGGFGSGLPWKKRLLGLESVQL